MNAAGPVAPTALSIKHVPDNASNSIDNEVTMLNVESAGRSFNRYKIPPSIPTIRVIIPMLINALGAMTPALLIIFKLVDKENINRERDAEIPRTLSIGKSDKIYSIPPSMPIAIVMISREPIAFPIVPEDLAISENMYINEPRAIVAPASFVPSIVDKAATAPAITPMATVIATIFPTDFVAPLVALIIAAMTSPSVDTAITPLANPSRGIILKSIAIAASIPIAIDIAIKVAATFAIFCSLPIVVICANTFTKMTKAATNAAPFSISPRESMLTSLHTPTISISETDIDNSNPPSFAICFCESSCVIFTNIPTNKRNAAANAPPLNISSGDSIPTSLHTPAKRIIAKDILTSIPPTLSIRFPDDCVTNTSAPTKAVKAAMNMPPFIISSVDKPPTSFITPISKSIENDNLRSILPALSMFWALFPFTSNPYAANTPPIATTKPARPINPCLA